MRKFTFRLEKVLEYRRLEEGWAKDTYRQAQAARMEGDAALASIGERRLEVLAKPVLGLTERRGLEGMLERLDGEEVVQRKVLAELMEDEAKAYTDWIERKQDLQALEKLRTREYDEWQLTANRKEQAALDEWSVLRRAA